MFFRPTQHTENFIDMCLNNLMQDIHKDGKFIFTDASYQVQRRVKKSE